jgi:hypothetical protein
MNTTTSRLVDSLLVTLRVMYRATFVEGGEAGYGTFYDETKNMDGSLANFVRHSVGEMVKDAAAAGDVLTLTRVAADFNAAVYRWVDLGSDTIDRGYCVWHTSSRIAFPAGDAVCGACEMAMYDEA